MTKKIRTSRPSTKTILFPDQRALERIRDRLKPFQPFDLRKIISEARVSGQLSPEQVRERRTSAQIKQLLRVLGLQEEKEPDWEQAFFRLAICVLHVGHIAFTPPRNGKSARRWDSSTELVLYGLVYRLTRQDLSERDAIKAITCDPKSYSQLPGYSRRSREKRESATERARRYNALWRQWQRTQKHSGYLTNNFRWDKDAPIFGGPPARSPLERYLNELDTTARFGTSLGDK